MDSVPGKSNKSVKRTPLHTSRRWKMACIARRIVMCPHHRYYDRAKLSRDWPGSLLLILYKNPTDTWAVLSNFTVLSRRSPSTTVELSLRMPKSSHHCSFEGCNKSKGKCTKHYIVCKGTPDATHSGMVVLKGTKCERMIGTGAERRKCGISALFIYS